MAGILAFQSRDWDISSGGFRAMAFGVARHLTDCCAGSAVRDALALAVESQLYFIDVGNSFSREMLDEFSKALELHISEDVGGSDSQFDDAVLRRGYMSRLGELRELVRQSLKDG